MITKEQAFGIHIGKKIIGGNVENNFGILTYVDMQLMRVGFKGFDEGHPFDTSYHINDCQLILRPLSAMTEEERNKYEGLRLIHLTIYTSYDTPQSTEYLISIGIDLFNFKKRGWAIYEEGK